MRPRLCTMQSLNMSSHIHEYAVRCVQTVNNSWLNFSFEINGLHLWNGSIADLLAGDDSNGIHNWNYVCASRHKAHLNFRLKLVLLRMHAFKMGHTTTTVVPHSFTHGSVQLRSVWFDDGYRPLGMLIHHLRLKQIIYTSLLCNPFRCALWFSPLLRTKLVYSVVRCFAHRRSF